MIAEQYYQNASETKKNWSATIDSVVHERPALIHRTPDSIMMMDFELLSKMLKDYKYHITIENEDDGSFTGYVEELQLVENADSQEALLLAIVEAMKDYALDFYSQFSYWSKAPNRISHIPYIIKLLASDEDMVMEDMVCQNGGN